MERHDRPRWAPRVSHRLIRELYEKNAAGIYDEDLADEVGYAFLARADSLVQTNRAHYDHVVNCPVCGALRVMLTIYCAVTVVGACPGVSIMPPIRKNS